ncbi:unnamed protein product, partial [Staurois parvus]
TNINLQSHPQLCPPATSPTWSQNINQTALFDPPKTFCSLVPVSPPPILASRTSPRASPRILPFLTNDTTKLLIHSRVIAHLDYCNSLLIGLPLHRLSPLQSIQPFSGCYPSLPIPPLTSTQCPPPLSTNPSTGLHSVSATPLCQSLHWPPLSVLHPSLPIP